MFVLKKGPIIAHQKTVTEMSESIPKKRAVISYENMSQELLDAFKEKYPHGYADYMGDIFKVEKPDGSSFYAVSLEIPDAVYLVKIKVKIDDYDDVQDDLFKDADDDRDDEDGDGDGGFPATDDDIAAAEAAEEDGE